MVKKDNLTAYPLTLERAKRLNDESERVFALAVLGVAHLEIFREPHVQGKRPDFYVRNTRRLGGKGKLVEVYSGSRSNLDKYPHKQEQQKAMQESGIPYTFICGENIEKLKR